MITIFNLDRVPTAILENSHSIGYSKEDNNLSIAHFKIPARDKKKKHIRPLHYAEIIDDQTNEYIGLYRILPKQHNFSRDVNELSFELEHVLGTLIGKTLFKYHQFTNFTTREVLQRLLNMQHTKHWVLGDVEFTRYFHYSFENENLLSAILSVPKAFDDPYIWETDTTSYPWTLHLRKPETEVSSRVVQGYNLEGFNMEENPNAIWNRIYPLGAGEGVNQLDIKRVNNGIPYVENTASIKEYGLYETTWADKRFTDEESLKSSAKGLLDKWSEPVISWQTDVLDVSSITGIEADKIRQGKICRITLDEYGEIDLRVISESKSDITGDPGSLQVTLGNIIEDLGTTQTDLERRQQINELYSQGATNILNFTYQDNADNNIPAVIPFYIDDDVVNMNTCELTFDTKQFRTYSGITEGGGGVIKSTSSGGSTTQTTTSGGSVSKSTESGGSTTRTSSSGGGVSTSTNSGGGLSSSSTSGGLYSNIYTGSELGATGTTSHYHMVAGDHLQHSHTFSVPSHSHNFSIGNHSHSVSIPAHTHNFTIPNHSHSITIPNHTHEINLPDHTHDVKHEIIELTSMPNSVEIIVDGNKVPHNSIRANRLDIVDYLSKDSNGRIQRGQHEIEIKPNGLARIEANLILRVFIQSQLGGQF